MNTKAADVEQILEGSAQGIGQGNGQGNGQGGAQASGEVNLDVVLDIPVTLSLEVGRSQISIRNLLQLNQGSVVELDRATGEPFDIYVNGTLIAHGEVVVVNDKFGIRLTDVISPAERIRKLK
jgi:flagellar motor switch protein FliN/FliY